MRRDEYVRQRPQGVTGGERLGVRDVERGAADRPRPKRRHKRERVDELASSDIDQPCIAAHERETLGRNHSLRLRRQGARENDVVAPGEQDRANPPGRR